MAERMRLDKLLANAGLGSRREVREWIKKGFVTCDGELVRQPDLQVDTDCDICCKGQPVQYQKYHYLMMNKPAGYVSANEDRRDATVMELLTEPWSNLELFVAGRLDKDTEGLLLLTNNGVFAHNMLAPKKHVPKTYYAQVRGVVTLEDVELFRTGVTIDGGYTCMSASLEVLEAAEISQIHLTICEGKFHQVKRMMEAVGKPVLYLRRIAIGGLRLDETLPLGEVRPLTRQEVLSVGATLGEK
ncbi:MAG: pseudouridine synthase [Eubacteriales bacterium]|jgi:16S rRNA pseudouridine516 synthase